MRFFTTFSACILISEIFCQTIDKEDIKYDIHQIAWTALESSHFLGLDSPYRYISGYPGWIITFLSDCKHHSIYKEKFDFLCGWCDYQLEETIESKNTTIQECLEQIAIKEHILITRENKIAAINSYKNSIQNLQSIISKEKKFIEREKNRRLQIIHILQNAIDDIREKFLELYEIDIS